MAIAGVQVKSINKKDKTVELEDGRKIPLPDDLAFEFFGSEAAKEKKQGYKEAIGQTHELLSNVPGGKYAVPYAQGHMNTDWFARLGDSALDYITEVPSSVSAGKGQESMGYLERLGENLVAKKKGREEGSREIASEFPKTSLAGNIGGLASSFVAPAPANPALQGGLMGLGLSDKNLVEDPVGLAKDVAIDTGVGFAVGKAAQGLEKIAAERRALRNFPDLLRQHKEANSQAEKKFIAEMARKLDGVEGELRGGIPKGSLKVQQFVDQNIGMSPMAATSEGRSLASFFNSLESAAPESMNSQELKKIFSTVESRILNASAEELPILNAFKTHLVQSLPIGAAENAVRLKFGTKLFNNFEKQVDKSVSKFLSDTKMIGDLKSVLGRNIVDDLQKSLKNSMTKGYEGIHTNEFINELQNGNLTNTFMDFIGTDKKLLNLQNKLDSEINKTINAAIGNKPLAFFRRREIPSLIKAQGELEALRNGLKASVSKAVANEALSADIYFKDVANKVTSKISNAVGVQNPNTNLQPTNMKPTPMPPLTPPQTGKLAPFFENPNFYADNLKKLGNFQGSGGLAKAGYLGSLAMGVPKAKMAAGVGAVAGGLTSALRGITSPTALGAVAREGIKQGGMRFIVESIADKYPSYDRGVLLDPMDRRAAASEVEQDQDIGLEDKAVLQARINRGQSIETLIKE